MNLTNEQVALIKKVLGAAGHVVSTAESNDCAWMHYELAKAIRDLDQANDQCWGIFLD